MLRDENEKNQRKVKLLFVILNSKKATELAQRVVSLETEISPLKEEIHKLNAINDVMVQEKTALQTQLFHWKTRVQNLLVLIHCLCINS